MMNGSPAALRPVTHAHANPARHFAGWQVFDSARPSISSSNLADFQHVHLASHLVSPRTRCHLGSAFHPSTSTVLCYSSQTLRHPITFFFPIIAFSFTASRTSHALSLTLAVLARCHLIIRPIRNRQLFAVLASCPTPYGERIGVQFTCALGTHDIVHHSHVTARGLVLPGTYARTSTHYALRQRHASSALVYADCCPRPFLRRLLLLGAHPAPVPAPPKNPVLQLSTVAAAGSALRPTPITTTVTSPSRSTTSKLVAFGASFSAPCPLLRIISNFWHVPSARRNLLETGLTVFDPIHYLRLRVSVSSHSRVINVEPALVLRPASLVDFRVRRASRPPAVPSSTPRSSTLPILLRLLLPPAPSRDNASQRSVPFWDRGCRPAANLLFDCTRTSHRPVSSPSRETHSRPDESSHCPRYLGTGSFDRLLDETILSGAVPPTVRLVLPSFGHWPPRLHRHQPSRPRPSTLIYIPLDVSAGP